MNDLGYSAQAAYHKMSDLGMGASIGAQKMMSDLGALMPKMTPQNQNEMMLAHHGMYANRMTMFGDMGSVMGWGTPRNTTMYEHQRMASQDFGSRIAGASVFGTSHTLGAAFSWFAGEKAMSLGWKAGRGYVEAKKVATAVKAGATVAEASAAVAAGGLGAAGVATGIAGAAIGMAPVLAISAGVDAIIDDVQDRQQMSKFLEASSWRYTPAMGKDIDAKHGGFNRQARSKITDTIKRIDFNSREYNMEDLKGILESGTELGMFNGARDAEDFGKKFKELTKTLKKVTKTLHTSLAEGMKTIKSLKQSGVADITSAVIQGDVLGAASGRTAAEMLTYGTQGAEMVRGTGVSTSAGFSMMQTGITATTLGARSGAVSASAIEQAGGIERLAQKSMGADIQYMQSSMGRGMLMAMGNKNGGLNMSAVQSILSGDKSVNDLADMAIGNSRDAAGYIKSVVGQEGRVRALGDSLGGRGIELMALAGHMANARNIARDSGVNMETALRFDMKQSGYAQSVIDNRIGTLHNLDKERESMHAANLRISRKALGELASERLDITGRLSDSFKRNMIAPISRKLNNVYDSIASSGSNALSFIQDKVVYAAVGVEARNMQDLSQADKIEAFFNSDMPEFKGKDSLTSSLYSSTDLNNFGKSSAFARINKEVGDKIFSAAAGKTNGIDAYSQALFKTDVKDLSRDQKMYMHTMMKKTGRTNLLSMYEGQRDSDRAQNEKDKLAFLGASDEDIEGFKEKRQEAIEGLLSESTGAILTKGSQDYQQVARAGGEEGILDILKIKKEIALNNKSVTGSLNKDDLDKKMKDAKMAFIKKAREKGTYVEGLEQSLDSVSSSNLSKKEESVLDYSNKIKRAEAARNKSQISVESDEQFNRTLSTGSDALYKKGKSADDVEDFQEKLRAFHSGEFNSGDLEGLRKYANEGGIGSLNVMIGRTESFKKFLDGKKSVSTGDFKNFLKNTGVDTTKLSQDYMDKLASSGDGDDRINMKEFAKFSMGLDSSGVAGKRYFGNGASSDMAEKETEVLGKLEAVQSKSAVVYHLLEQMVSRLDSK